MERIDSKDIDSDQIKDLIDFALNTGKLKDTVRTGWVVNVDGQIPNSESVADHSWRMAILAKFLAPKFGIEPNLAAVMALIHDLGEAESGDEVVQHGSEIVADSEAKLKKERGGLEKIMQDIDPEGEILQMFDEFEEGITPLAMFIKQIDKLDMALQALDYHKKYGVDLSKFIENARLNMKDPLFITLMEEIEKRY